jgi:hypothetical protein
MCQVIEGLLSTHNSELLTLYQPPQDLSHFEVEQLWRVHSF